MRLSFYSLAVLVCCSTFASADLKIKTRTTVMGHSTESTVYIKGSRERNEMSFGGRGGMTTIMQCDQHRMITIGGDQCMVMSMGGAESSCPAIPNMRGKAGREPEPTGKGGVVTITLNSTDTGERQDMFGYKARHIKTSMSMEPSPDACNQSRMKMEMDGWYADFPGFSCSDNSYQGMACASGAQQGCNDRIVTKNNGVALGYPLKQTTTIDAGMAKFSTTTEVVELTSTPLDPPLFEMPPGCKVMDLSAAAGGDAPSSSPAPSAPSAAPAPAAQPALPPAPAVAAKAPGVIRIGVVKIKDASGQSLPTDNLLLSLMSEITRQQLEAIPLSADAPPAEVDKEARANQCDYVLYTVSAQVKEPGTGGIAPASLPKGVTLDATKFQALTGMTLYKVGKPQPELKDVMLAADANQFAVDAVSATFVLESNRLAQQVAEDAHAKPASKAAKPTAGATKPK